MKTLKLNYVLYGVLIVAIVGLSVFSVYKNTQAKDYANEIRMDYQRCFTELVQYVDDLSVTLEKSKFVNDPRQMMLLSGEIYRQAAQASANLALLPLKAEPLEHISKFLSQVGNFSYSLSLKMLDGNEISKEEYESLSQLTDYANILAKNLDKDLEDLYNGRLDIRKAASNTEESQINVVMGELEQQLHDYPALIYDGPFSSHLTDRESVYLAGKGEITSEEAIEKAKTLMGKNLQFDCVEEKGNIPAYYLTAKDGENSYSIAITKRGGCLLYYLNDRVVTEENKNIADAKIAGVEFLEAAGYKNMEENYYETISNMAVINYSPRQEGYTLYPDLVKVKVALDTGEVIGCEARGYIMYHKERDIPQIQIRDTEALEKVNPNVDVKSISLAVIPQDSGKEEFCWQIEGESDNRKCLIYINTQSGAEEKIFLLIESDTGVLAV